MRRPSLVWVLLLGCFVTATACGGLTTTDGADATSDATGTDTSASDVGIPRVDAGNFCAEAAGRFARCHRGFDAARCAKAAACFGTVFKPDDGAVYIGCLTKSDCSTSEASCADVVATRYGSDPATQAFAKACRDKRAACGGGFTDSLCSAFYGALQAPYFDQLKACLDQPCDAVKGCSDAIFKAAGCP